MFRNQKLCVCVVWEWVRGERVRLPGPPHSGDSGGGGAFTRKAGWRTDLGEEAELSSGCFHGGDWIDTWWEVSDGSE